MFYAPGGDEGASSASGVAADVAYFYDVDAIVCGEFLGERMSLHVGVGAHGGYRQEHEFRAQVNDGFYGGRVKHVRAHEHADLAVVGGEDSWLVSAAYARFHFGVYGVSFPVLPNEHAVPPQGAGVVEFAVCFFKHRAT